MFDVNTPLGQIRFSNDSVIERIIQDAAALCDGRVALANYKGKYMSVVPSGTHSIVETDEGIDIVVYIVMDFGASIGKYSKQMLEYIYDTVEEVMGKRPHSVKIIVTGIRSRDIAKRHIEITE